LAQSSNEFEFLNWLRRCSGTIGSTPDLLNCSLTLDAGTTKNGEGRTVKLTSETFELVKRCVFSKAPESFLFTRSDGHPVRDFRDSWAKLTETAKLPGLLFHDLRRSAVRNMVRRGVPEVVAMRISGHKTRSIFDRYNIVNEADLENAALKLEQGARLEFGHTSGIVEPSTQRADVQPETKPLYNQ
jgi:integrase